MGEGHLALKLWEGEGRDLAEAGEEEEAAVGELGVLEGGGGEAAHPQAAQGGRAGPPHHHPLVGRHAGHLHQLLLHPLHYLTLLTALSLVKAVLTRLNCSQLS